MKLPLADCIDGPVFDRIESCDTNDAAFADWEAPLVWHHQKSYLCIDSFFKGQRSLHFAFSKRIPSEVWQKGWHLWYDNAVVHRQTIADARISGRFAMEEVTFGYGGDNNESVGARVGIIARMRDTRSFYLCCLEYPNRVVLYRREDDQWVVVGSQQIHLDVFTEYELVLEMRGNQFVVWLDQQFLFKATDYAFAEGWCGVRTFCESFVTHFEIEPLTRPAALPIDRPWQTTADALPPAHIVGELDLSAHGNLSKTIRHNAGIEVGRIAHDDAPQLLVDLFDAPDGASHVLLELDGSVIWKADLGDVGRLIPTPPRPDGGHDLYAVTKDALLIVDGHSGQITRRAERPASSIGKRSGHSNGPVISADIDGSGRRDHFFITYGADDQDIYCIGPDLAVRWHHVCRSGNGHGHHNSVCDVDGDGREEVFAGCQLLSADGQVIWTQEEIARRLKCPNGGHVDSSVMGYFAGPEAPPTLHLSSSSAGHIVCDARSGEILAAHPSGHAQFISAGSIVPGSEWVFPISTNRWGSYGVTRLVAPMGEMVGRFQPGFVCQSTTPLNWTGDGTELLLVLDGPGWRGIYDHQGHRLLDLDPLVPYSDAFAQRYDRVNKRRAPLVAGDPRDTIVIRLGNRLRLIAPDRPLSPGSRVFAPERRTNISWPGWTTV